jgi:hypothetical protein
MLVSGSSEGTAAEPFFATGSFGLSASSRTAAAAMNDGDQKEEKRNYGEVFDSCFYLAPFSASRPSVWAIKLSKQAGAVEPGPIAIFRWWRLGITLACC